MVEYDRTQERDHVTSHPMKICVVGVGGAGLNVLDRITLDRIIDATLVSMHTDVRVLSHAMTPHKLQLGSEIMRGIGSGGDPELGREAAEASRESIRSLVQGHDMIFICAGLGGGTGSGAAPVIADIAKETGAMVFVFATTPFSFEGRRRLTQAEIALEELQQRADALILFENNRMGELTLPREGIQKAFSQADQLIGHSVRAISSMVMQPGIVRLGLSDLMTALRSPNSRCLFGFGEARGANRVSEALKRALKSPLINQGVMLQQARNLLVHVSGGESLTLVEVEGLMKQLGKHVPEQTQILFGVSIDPKLGESIAVTLLSSLAAHEINGEAKPAIITTAPPAAPVAKEAVPANAKPAPAHVPAALVEAKVAPVKTKVVIPVVPATQSFDLFASQETTITTEASSPPPPPVEEPVAVRAEAPPPPPPVEPAPVPVVEAKIPEPPAPVIIPEPEPVAATVAAAPPPPPPEPEFVEAKAPPVPASRLGAQRPEAPAAKPSIFSVIEDDEEEIEDEVQDSVIPVRQASPMPEVPSKQTSSYQPARNRADEEQHVAPPPAVAVAPAKSAVAQPSLNLHQEEVARFKGTDRNIVEGEDLDVPTWMRARAKAGKR